MTAHLNDTIHKGRTVAACLKKKKRGLSHYEKKSVDSFNSDWPKFLTH